MENNKYWQGHGEIRTLGTANENRNWCSCHVTLITEPPGDPAIPFVSVFQELQVGPQTLFTHVYNSIIHNTKRQKHPKCLSTDEQNVVRTYNGIFFSLSKTCNSEISYNTDKPWRLGAQWNKPGTRGYTVRLHYCEVLIEANSQSSRANWGGTEEARGCRAGAWKGGVAARVEIFSLRRLCPRGG